MRVIAIVGLGWALAQSLPESDCRNAIPVCQQSYTYTNSPPDFGQTQELANNTCLLNNEQKTVWFIFTVQQSGTFGFTINTSFDYDFALWDITNSSCSIVGGSTPIRCNFSAQNGNTGLDPNQTDPNPLSYPASDPPFMPGLNVTAGQTFVLVLDNYTRDQTGFTITFSGTANIFDNTPPLLLSAQQDCQQVHRIILRFNEPIACNTVASNGSDFLISGGVVPVAAGCIGGGRFSQEVYIDLPLSIPSGTYTITLQPGTDGNTISDKCGNFAPAGQSVQVTLLGSLVLNLNPIEVCAGQSVQLTGQVLGGLPPGGVATWSTGASGLSTVHTPPTPADFEEPFWYPYTFTVALGGCTYSLTDSVRVHPIPRAEITPRTIYSCAGRAVEVTGLSSVPGGNWEEWNGSGWIPLSEPLIFSPGRHTVRYRSPAGCTGDSFSVQVISLPLTAGTCNVQYVTPTGDPSAPGTKNAPTSLEAALLRLQCRTGIIKLAEGTYLLTQPITTLTDSVILEGGYDPTMGWTKRSDPGRTVLRRLAQNIEGCESRYPRLVGFQVHGAKAFRLQDLTIEIDDAPSATASCAEGRGISTYGLYLRGCQGYEVVRCQVIVGDASAGMSGAAGRNGRPGGNGACGGAGAAATPTFGICLPPLGTPPPPSAGAGGIGGASPVGNAGGGGGNSGFMTNGQGGAPGQGASGGMGGTAGALCFSGLIGGGACSCTQVPLPGVPPSAGGNGQDGANGAPGRDGVDGSPGQLVQGFWRPGSRGKPGEDGQNGSGGGGGGAGGGGANIAPPACPTIGAGGGGGGGGGEKGTGGEGGSGGGSSYAAVLVNNGPGSAWIQSFLVAGAAGAGGQGGAGGLGGSGGQGAGPCIAFDGGCNAGNGGKGGNGGSGGSGGRGGNGRPGQSNPFLQDGVPPTLSEVSFNLSTQPSIQAGTAHCTDVDITFSSASGGAFTDLGAGAIPPNLPSNNGAVRYATTGAKNIRFATHEYPRFWTILASPSAISLHIRTLSDTFCVGEVIAVSSEQFALSYEWTVFYAGQVVFQATTDTLRFTANQPGRYTLRLRVETDCCGWIGPVEKEIEVVPAPQIRAQGASGCFPLTLRAELVTGSTGGTFIWYDADGDSVGTGTELLLAGPTADPSYTVVYRVGGCISPTQTVSVQGTATPVLTGISSVPPLSPPPDGPITLTFLASYLAPGGSSVDFTWLFGDGQQAASSTPSVEHFYLPGTYELVLIAAIGGCRDTLSLQVVIRGNWQLAFPNVFSPNGDGINEVWTPVGTGIRQIRMRIYDRWGRLLYEGAGPWRGDNAAEGVYTYLVEVELTDGSRFERAGTVTLLR